MHEPPKDADRLYLHRADEVETDPNSLARLQTRLEFKKKVTKKLKNNMGLISKQNGRNTLAKTMTLAKNLTPQWLLCFG